MPAGAPRVCAQTLSDPAYCRARRTALSLPTVNGALVQRPVKQVFTITGFSAAYQSYAELLFCLHHNNKFCCTRFVQRVSLFLAFVPLIFNLQEVTVKNSLYYHETTFAIMSNLQNITWVCICLDGNTKKKQYRKRMIIQAPANGGQDCPEVLSQERECEAPSVCQGYR